MMKVNSISQKIYKSRIIKHGLKFAAENGALFIAGTSLAFSTFVRPVATLLTPKVDRENKILPFAKSVSSSLIGYVLMLGVSLPLARGIRKIDKNPLKYLKSFTIQALGESGKTLAEAKAYQLATQLFKLGLGLVIAAPKAFLTNKLIPPVMKIFFKDTESLNEKHDKELTFGSSKDVIPNSIGKILDKEGLQKFAQKFKDTNFRMHIIALTDAFSTFVFARQVSKNDEIKDNKKKILINNAVISTALCIGLGYVLDKAFDKPTQGFVKRFSEVNKGDKNLPKYIEGIKLAKPALILGTIYYGLIPVISTFWADRLEKINKLN